MLRRSVATLVVFFLLVSTLLAADKIVKGTLIKVELKKHQLLLKTDDGKKTYSVDAKTKFIGPRGGVSDAGIKDDRLKPAPARARRRRQQQDAPRGAFAGTQRNRREITTDA